MMSVQLLVSSSVTGIQFSYWYPVQLLVSIGVGLEGAVASDWWRAIK